MAAAALDRPSLMAFWARHKAGCRPIGDIVSDARAGTLPGIERMPSGFGFMVTDEGALLTAIRKNNPARMTGSDHASR